MMINDAAQWYITKVNKTRRRVHSFMLPCKDDKNFFLESCQGIATS